MSDTKPSCVYCQATDEQIPLIQIVYRNEPYWICPQHFPLLIHNPRRLAGKLPGVENLAPSAEEEHHP